MKPNPSRERKLPLFIDGLGYIGALLISLVPFVIKYPFGFWFGIVALGLMIPQGIRLKTWNLVAANFVGLFGFVWSFLL